LIKKLKKVILKIKEKKLKKFFEKIKKNFEKCQKVIKSAFFKKCKNKKVLKSENFYFILYQKGNKNKL